MSRAHRKTTKSSWFNLCMPCACINNSISKQIKCSYTTFAHSKMQYIQFTRVFPSIGKYIGDICSNIKYQLIPCLLEYTCIGLLTVLNRLIKQHTYRAHNNKLNCNIHVLLAVASHFLPCYILFAHFTPLSHFLIHFYCSMVSKGSHALAETHSHWGLKFSEWKASKNGWKWLKMKDSMSFLAREVPKLEFRMEIWTNLTNFEPFLGLFNWNIAFLAFWHEKSACFLLFGMGKTTFYGEYVNFIHFMCLSNWKKLPHIFYEVHEPPSTSVRSFLHFILDCSIFSTSTKNCHCKTVQRYDMAIYWNCNLCSQMDSACRA